MHRRALRIWLLPRLADDQEDVQRRIVNNIHQGRYLKEPGLSMGDVIFHDLVRTKRGEYFLSTANNLYPNRITSSFFRNGALLFSHHQEYEANISSENLMARAREFHDSKREEIQALVELVDRLRETEHAETRNLLGQAFLAKGMYDEAIGEFEEAIALNSNASMFYNNLGSAFLASARYDSAIEALERAVEINPEYADYRNNLGVAYLKKRLCKKARAQFQHAIGINPNYAEAHFNMVLALVLNAATQEDPGLAVNYAERAIDILKKVKEIQLNYNDERVALGESYLNRNEPEKAYDTLAEAQRQIGKPTDMFFIIDFYLRVIHDSKKLNSTFIWNYIRQLQEVLDKHPNRPDLYNHLGVAYVIMSKFVNHKAIQQFQKALQINPSFEGAVRNKRLVEYDHKGIQLLVDAIIK
jgi:tetratricopeptide (TPR) repeat protein